MKAGNRTKGARLRIVLEEDGAIGPGKADILDGIRETGSIAAAGRRMGMSYKRAWSLVERMNRSFREPLVSTSRGGHSKGGAALTGTGEQVLALYRRIETEAERAVEPELGALRALMNTEPSPPPK